MAKKKMASPVKEKPKETYPHFKHYLKSGHPALVVF